MTTPSTFFSNGKASETAVSGGVSIHDQVIQGLVFWGASARAEQAPRQWARGVLPRVGAGCANMGIAGGGLVRR